MEIAGGILVWGFAIVVPAAFLILGVARLVSVLEALSGSRPKRVTPHLARALGADHLAATDLVLPGGRRLHELVLGPFGIVVLGDVPPPSVTPPRGAPLGGPRQPRPVDPHREPRAARQPRRRACPGLAGRPTTGTSSSASTPPSSRTTDASSGPPTCAVVPTAELGAWLEALPVQRGLTAARREHLVELIRTVGGTARRADAPARSGSVCAWW